MRIPHRTVAGWCFPLFFGLISCSSRLDLGHDLQSAVLTPNGSNTPDASDASAQAASDASSTSDAADADTADAADAATTPTIPTAPSTPTASTCVGSPCFAGPVVDMASSMGSAKGLVVDADNVYWAADAAQALLFTPKDGSETLVDPTPIAGPFRVAIDDTTVYFTSPSGGYVASAPKTTRSRLAPKLPPPITVLVSGEPEPLSIVVGTEGIYFADEKAGTLKRTALDGSNPKTLVTGLSAGCELALDADYLYYVDPGIGEIHAIDRVSGKNTLITAGRTQPVAPAPRGDTLYFLELGTKAANFADGRLLSVPRTGGVPQVLMDALDAPTALAADTAALYLCTRGTTQNGFLGKIVRLGDDGQVSTLAIDQAEPFAIAVDGAGVYWTTDADNALHTIAR
jgi:hypothetical protein